MDVEGGGGLSAKLKLYQKEEIEWVLPERDKSLLFTAEMDGRFWFDNRTPLAGDLQSSHVNISHLFLLHAHQMCKCANICCNS